MGKERLTIKEMPDKETLEKYINQQNGEEVEVSFNIKEGVFEWLIKRDTKPKEKKNEV